MYNRITTVFLGERARFSRVKPELISTRLEIWEKELYQNSVLRDLAFCMPESNLMVVCYRLESFPSHNIIGVIQHEFGHLVDSEPYIPNSGGEQRADDIAERITGFRIKYDRHDVQTIATGTYPRPKHLHR